MPSSSRRRRAGCARSSPSRAAPSRSAPRPCWRASPTRASGSSVMTLVSVSSLDVAAPRTSSRAGTGCRRASPRRARTASRAAGGCRAGPARGRRAGSRRRRPARAGGGRSCPDAMPPPTSRYSTERSAIACPRNSLICAAISSPLVLLEEVGGALDHAQLPGARDQVDEPLAGLGGEDRVGVREADERRLLPRARAARGRRSSRRRPARPSSIGTSSGNCATPAFDSAFGHGAS